LFKIYGGQGESKKGLGGGKKIPLVKKKSVSPTISNRGGKRNGGKSKPRYTALEKKKKSPRKEDAGLPLEMRACLTENRRVR